ncbi:MAG: HD domain-containing protein [Bacteroidaceae bacterium]|nr:HD domain-containing protein [Bacteroidaceae bacterium]
MKNRCDIPNDLQQYVEENIIPHYASFDKAHREDHVLKVMEESLRLSTFFDVDVKMVYVIAAYHDVGLCEGREIHHLASARIMRQDNRLKVWFSEEEIDIMCEAVEDHRASNRHVPRSVYGRIVAEADRCIEPYDILVRTIQYGLSHYPQLSKEEQYERYCEHLQEKYAESGYLRLWVPQSSNAEGLAELRRIISDSSKRRLLFDEIYQKEK